MTDPCPATDLPREECPHCAQHEKLPKMKLSTGEFGMPFLAKYEAICGNCKGTIAVGEVTALLADGFSYGCRRCLP